MRHEETIFLNEKLKMLELSVWVIANVKQLLKYLDHILTITHWQNQTICFISEFASHGNDYSDIPVCATEYCSA